MTLLTLPITQSTTCKCEAIKPTTEGGAGAAAGRGGARPHELCRWRSNRGETITESPLPALPLLARGLSVGKINANYLKNIWAAFAKGNRGGRGAEDVLSKDEKVRVLCKRFVTFPLCQGKMHKIWNKCGVDMKTHTVRTVGQIAH